MEFDLTINNLGIRNLVNQSRHRDRILQVLHNDLLKRPLADSNCHGFTLYLMKELDLPSCVEPEEMNRVMSNNYRANGGRESIIAAWNNLNGFLYHTGLYLGDLSGRKIVFEQRGEKGEYGFGDFGYFFEEFFTICDKKFETDWTVLFHGKSK